MDSPTILGTGDFKYRLIPDWARLPEGWDFHEVAAVAVDSRDQVYVFSRSAHPVTVFDRDGTFLRSWGEGVFKRAHGLSMAPDDTIFCTDDGDHSVRRCTPEGKVLLTLGTPARRSLTWVANRFASAPTPRFRQAGTSMSPMGTATPACTNTRPMAG